MEMSLRQTGKAAHVHHPTAAPGGRSEAERLPGSSSRYVDAMFATACDRPADNVDLDAIRATVSGGLPA